MIVSSADKAEEDDRSELKQDGHPGTADYQRGDHQGQNKSERKAEGQSMPSLYQELRAIAKADWRDFEKAAVTRDKTQPLKKRRPRMFLGEQFLRTRSPLRRAKLR